jgi:LacI family transcriptional regulator
VVTPDDTAGIELAVRHLAELGHRRILHLAGPQTTSTGVVRMPAFRSAVRDHGLDDDPALVVACDYWTEARARGGCAQVLDAGTGFTAIVAGNDLIALGCYDVFAERGISARTT